MNEENEEKDVDPYLLSYEDEDAYYAQKNGTWSRWERAAM